MAEMFAFCIAAAHLKLPHQMIDSMMISSINESGEGWALVDKIPIDGICEFGKHPQHDVYAVPSLIHYCQHYTVDDLSFYKRKMGKDFFTCESPLLMVPSNEMVSKQLPAVNDADYQKNESRRKSHGFVLCALLSALNDAARYFKEHQCGVAGNLQESIRLR